jgi:preflagellin peptidase FlaK
VSLGSTPDLLRLLAVPVLGWAAWRDLRTRRVPNRTWLPLLALALVTLVWDARLVAAGPAYGLSVFLVRLGLSVGLLVPLAYGFWRLGAFGGADAKAFMLLALLFPAYPVYYLPGVALPLVRTVLGVFSLTVLTDTVLLGLAYPLALGSRNLLAGRFTPVAFVGLPVPWRDLESTAGRMLETPAGYTRGGLDLDALRMYLRWRGLDLAALRADPSLRNPATLPEDPHPPTDGAVQADGGAPESGPASVGGRERAPGTANASDAPGVPDASGDDGDPWGAAAFLEDVDHDAYGTTPEQLRTGLDLATERETVWVSPGIPFLVPLFLGLLVALTYGDLLFALLRAVGLA